MSFAVGTIVKARGRQWVVMPESKDDWLMVQPLGGSSIEKTGILQSLEKVELDHLGLPSPDDLGDHLSCRLLRDAVKLGFRSSAGPFRCFGSISVEPRPYQIVPLLMALRQEYVRLLISDDVGIGKTIEAGLIAKEFISRGEVSSIAVLCPPHLVPQWNQELSEKFHLECEIVLPSTIKKLERQCAHGESVFERFPNVILSLDFIKADRYREEFLQKCPELVIVDEAHTCAWGASGKQGRHQRFELISRISKNPKRHLILVTATPHSGNEAAFRSLLTLVNSDFAQLPDDLTGKENEQFRRKLSEYLVQRNRVDIKEYENEASTRFPTPLEKEETYSLKESPDYQKLFDQAIKYSQEIIQDLPTGTYKQRVRWWSALALLRSVASSPAAAAETMRNRAEVLGFESLDEMDEHGQRLVMDMGQEDTVQPIDYSPGSDIGNEAENEDLNRRKLNEMAKAADDLKGAKDIKLQKVLKILKPLIADGFQPIIFCRFIPTAQYVAEFIQSELKNVAVGCVTGLLAPAEREERVQELESSEKRVLVCTDCLSEGINLQDLFNAVIHYDLSWNPTRHAQRVGRVDRFGQKKSEVRVVTYYGIDNRIDGIVLDVLLRKHNAIQSKLGISVPVPVNSNQVIEAIFEGLLLKKGSNEAEQLSFLNEIIEPKKQAILAEWQSIEERTKKNRTVFAQRLIKPEELFPEIKQQQNATGAGVEMREFLHSALIMLDAGVTGASPMKIDIEKSPLVLRDRIWSATGWVGKFAVTFDPTQPEKGHYITRTHPFVETIAGYVVDTALESRISKPVSKRCGVIRTDAVATRTTLLLARFRFHIVVHASGQDQALLAEDCRIFAFEGAPSQAAWLSPEKGEALLGARPVENIHPEQQRMTIQKILDDFDSIKAHLEDSAALIGSELLESHKRVRTASARKGISYDVNPKLPVDVLGLYVFLPSAQGRQAQ
jgi:SNF2 family DNA or RNA helicase